MMKINWNITFRCLLIAAAILSITSVSGQIPDPGNGGTGAPVGAPLDMGALLLLIAGSIFGTRHLINRKKRG